MLITIITFIAVLSLLVFVHELGHFWVARKFGVKAEEFGFGFPPRAIGVYRDEKGKWKIVRGKKEVKDAGDTIYSINWVPLGGFVRIKGEDGTNKDKDSFGSKKIWQRASILLAGVTMNVVLAAVLISAGFMIGLPQSLDDLPARAKVLSEQIQITEVLKDTPAEKAGLEMGDFILAVNGEEIKTEEQLMKITHLNTGQETEYKLKRGKETVVIKITPEILEDTGRGGIGVGFAQIGIVKYPFFTAVAEGVKTTGSLFLLIVAAFYELLKNLILGQGVSADIAGPVGIVNLTGQVAQMGFIYILQFTAILSINLAIINAFPFPALDGGRLLFLAIETIFRRPVKREVEAVIHNIGFALLMVLIVLVTYRDIIKLFN